MVADFEKYNAEAGNVRDISLRRALGGKSMIPARMVYDLIDFFVPQKNIQPIDKEFALSEFRWFHFGIEDACAELRNAGFLIIDEDMEVIPRDPMIHFVKE